VRSFHSSNQLSHNLHLKLRILLYSLNFSPELTGIGKYSGEMAQWLSSAGYSVRVVTAPPYYPAWSVFAGFRNQWSVSVEAGVRVYRCPLYVPASDSGVRRILHLLSFALSSFPVMLWQVMWRPDVVWVVQPTLAGAPTAWLTARLSGAKAWLHVQDFEVDMAFEMGLLRWAWLRRLAFALERVLMRRFNRISTISASMRSRLLQKGVAVERVRDFPNWADVAGVFPLNRPSALRAALGIVEGEVVALYSGNMGQKQGLELLIEAARRMAVSAPAVRFVLCGEGAAKASLQRAAEGMPNILWLPLQPLDQLNELLNVADLHLLPQRADAADLVMPSKLTNMLASGRPVIATALEGTEVFRVVQGCGLVTPPGDVDALVTAIQRLASDSALRVRLGQAARSYAEQHLAKDAILRRFEADLEQLCR
jgi:colanic acid biosynthesis glycosyl transferase WcaI